MTDETLSTELVETKVSYGAIEMTPRGAPATLIPKDFGEVVAFAQMMSRADIALPKHLRGNPGACMAVALQAFDWQMSPFAVANKTYFVNDRLAYEAQLVAAVVHTRAPIKSRPTYDFIGQDQTRQCVVKVEMLEGTVKEYISPEIGKIKVKNSPLWTGDPDQQLGYFSIRAWARRHCPEVIMGVYTPEEVQQIVTQERDTATGFDDLEARAAAKAVEHVQDAEFVEEKDPPAPKSASAADSRDGPAAEPASGLGTATDPGLEPTGGEPSQEMPSHEAPGDQFAHQVAEAVEEASGSAQEADRAQSGAQDKEEAQSALAPATEALATFAEAVAEANDWPQIERAVYELSKSPAWPDIDAATRSNARRIAYARLKELVDLKHYGFDFITNPQAYRCYLEFETDAEALKGNRDMATKMKVFIDLPTNAKIALDKAYDDRMAVLKAAPGGAEEFS